MNDSATTVLLRDLTAFNVLDFAQIALSVTSKNSYKIFKTNATTLRKAVDGGRCHPREGCSS